MWQIIKKTDLNIKNCKRADIIFQNNDFLWGLSEMSFAENAYNLFLCSFKQRKVAWKFFLELEQILLNNYPIILLFVDINETFYQENKTYFDKLNWKVLDQKAISFLREENILQENELRLKKVYK